MSDCFDCSIDVYSQSRGRIGDPKIGKFSFLKGDYKELCDLKGPEKSRRPYWATQTLLCSL